MNTINVPETMKRSLDLAKSKKLSKDREDESHVIPGSHKYYTPFLPPCRICDDTASGLHYGVISCEACKGFFRRTLDHKGTYKCRSGTRNCEDVRTCSYCRQQKCLAEGMSKCAIRHGRYTHETRTQTTREVKKLMKDVPVTSSCSPDMLPFSPVEDLLRCCNGLEESEIEETVLSVHAAFTEGNSLREMAEKEEFLVRQTEFYESIRLRESMFGELKPIPRDEYYYFLQLTGIDVDNRENVAETILRHAENSVIRMILFAGALPGFDKLKIEDQAALIKVARYEHFLMLHESTINTELRILTWLSGDFSYVSDLGCYYDSDIIDKSIKFIQKIRLLQLTLEEQALLMAVCITASDRAALQEPDKVETIQWRLLICLRYLICKNHSEPNRTFYRIFDCIVFLRSLSERSNQITMEVVHDYPENAKKTCPVWCELMYH